MVREGISFTGYICQQCDAPLSKYIPEFKKIKAGLVGVYHLAFLFIMKYNITNALDCPFLLG